VDEEVKKKYEALNCPALDFLDRKLLVPYLSLHRRKRR